MQAPDKIYIQTNAGEAFSSKWTTIPFRDFENTEYIRKDIVEETIKTAEDHAYFAGQEKFREELMEWAKFVLKCQEEELAKYDGPSYMRASIMGRIDAYKVLIAKLKSL
jgi:hypothetical protein